MTPVTALALEVVYHGSAAAQIAPWVAPLNAAMERYDIVTPERQAAFVAQVGHESQGLAHVEEGLVYSSAERIALIFRNEVDRNHDGEVSPDELAFAQRFVRQPTLLANFVYASRGGNGPEASGDGFRYRGRGPIQISLKDNYRACSTSLFRDASVLLDNPDLLLKPEHGSMAAAWFFWSHGCNELADEANFKQITREINPALDQYGKRCDLWKVAKQVLV